MQGMSGNKQVINHGSTADFVPPSVYIGFRLFVLLERRWSDISSIFWSVRWTFVSWENSSVGTQSCPTPPGRFAGRFDLTRPWYVRVWDSTGPSLNVRREVQDSGHLYTVLWLARGTDVSWASQNVEVLLGQGDPKGVSIGGV